MNEPNKCIYSYEDEENDEVIHAHNIFILIWFKIFMSLSIQNKIIGASFYNSKTNIIHMISDFENDTKFQRLINSEFSLLLWQCY